MLSGLSRSNRPFVRTGIVRRKIPVSSQGTFALIKDRPTVGSTSTSDEIFSVNSTDGIRLASTDPSFSPMFKQGSGVFNFTRWDNRSNTYLTFGKSTLTGYSMTSDSVIAWASSTSTSAAALTGTYNGIMGCEAANIFQFGADSATAVAQMIKGPDGLGADKAAGDLIAAGGRPTGAGTEGNFIVQTAPAAGSSSTQGTLATRLTVNSVSVAASVPLKLSSYTVAGVPSASTAGAGSMIWVSNESGGACPAVSDGTNWKKIAVGATIS